MTRDEFTLWLTSRGYALSTSSCGHTGRADAWTKVFPGTPATRTVRFFADATQVRRESSTGFGRFSKDWKAPYSQLSLNAEGKLCVQKS